MDTEALRKTPLMAKPSIEEGEDQRRKATPAVDTASHSPHPGEPAPTTPIPHETTSVLTQAVSALALRNTLVVTAIPGKVNQ